jgi:hypothetical protein
VLRFHDSEENLIDRKETDGRIVKCPNVSATAKQFGISNKTVRQWKQKQAEIKKTRKKITRCRVEKKRSPMYVEKENQLYTWITEKRDQGASINGCIIQGEARKLINPLDPMFTASNGWLSGFLKRNNLAFRRITTSGRDLSGKFKLNFR